MSLIDRELMQIALEALEQDEIKPMLRAIALLKERLGQPDPEPCPIYMAEVTMPDPDIWCHGKAECLNCGHEWTAVWPLAAESLECPRCGSTDTDRDQAGPHTLKTR
jgi:hypothetical protein